MPCSAANLDGDEAEQDADVSASSSSYPDDVDDSASSASALETSAVEQNTGFETIAATTSNDEQFTGSTSSTSTSSAIFSSTSTSTASSSLSSFSSTSASNTSSLDPSVLSSTTSASPSASFASTSASASASPSTALSHGQAYALAFSLLGLLLVVLAILLCVYRSRQSRYAALEDDEKRERGGEKAALGDGDGGGGVRAGAETGGELGGQSGRGEAAQHDLSAAGVPTTTLLSVSYHTVPTSPLPPSTPTYRPSTDTTVASNGDIDEDEDLTLPIRAAAGYTPAPPPRTFAPRGIHLTAGHSAALPIVGLVPPTPEGSVVSTASRSRDGENSAEGSLFDGQASNPFQRDGELSSDGEGEDGSRCEGSGESVGWRSSRGKYGRIEGNPFFASRVDG